MEATISTFTEHGTTLYEITIKAPNKTETSTYASLEAALDSFSPPLTRRVRSHIVEELSVGGKPDVVFCLEDSVERQ